MHGTMVHDEVPAAPASNHMAPPLVVPAAAAAVGAAQPQQHFELYAHSGRLHASNSPDEVHIKGVTWSGLDGGTNRRPGYAA